MNSLKTLWRKHGNGIRHTRWLLSVLVFNLLAATTAFAQAPVSTDFQRHVVAEGLDLPMEFEISKDGRAFVVGKCGAFYAWNLDGGVASQTSTETEAGLPGPLDLGSNYPNPFNPETTIAFTLAEAGPVRLEVFDASGRRVATLLDAPRPAGRHAVRWDAGGLASGVYLCRLSAAHQTRTRLLTLQK